MITVVKSHGISNVFKDVFLRYFKTATLHKQFATSFTNSRNYFFVLQNLVNGYTKMLNAKVIKKVATFF